MVKKQLLLITIPIFFPVSESLGYDPVWFAVDQHCDHHGCCDPYCRHQQLCRRLHGPGDQPAHGLQRVSLLLPCFVICIILLLFWPGVVMWLPGVLLG